MMTMKEKGVQMLCRGFMAAGFAVLILLFLTVPAMAQKQMSVQVRGSQLRATPSFLGKTLASVNYGERVDVLEERGDWMRIALRGGKQKGWIHRSALTTKRIVLKAGQAGVRTGATQDELALAGKGFNEQVEKSFRSKNQNLDYAWVNKMETFTVSAEQMRHFVAQGQLVPSGEGDKP